MKIASETSKQKHEMSKPDRDGYGAIRNDLDTRALVVEAIRQGVIADEYCDFDRKGRGSCLNYDVYDWHKPSRTLLIQERVTTGNKHGMSPRKRYLLLSRHRGRWQLDGEAPMQTSIAKLAKLDPRLGHIILTITGQAGRPLRLRRTSEQLTGYKAVALVNGELRSIFSGRLFRVGGTYRETARPEHRGGYYYYRSVEEAHEASVPTASALIDQPRVIVEVKVGGRVLAYDNGKRAASRMTITRIVGGTWNADAGV